ncbi:MAG: chorismate mutase [Acholeplasmataceae bacterium]
MNLDELRSKINEIDENILALFEERMHVSKQIGLYKKEHNLPVLDQTREDALLNLMKSKVKDQELINLYEVFLKHLMTLSKAYQNEI